MNSKFRRWTKQIINNLYVIVGVVFVWRGAWALLDIFEYELFAGSHIGFSIVLILIGVGLMYLHDHRYDRLDHF